MSVAQWAPWVSVFLGGCLSGAALLSLSSERALDAKRPVTLTAPPSPPADPTEHDEVEVADEDDRATEPDVTASHRDESEAVESEEGPSAADILSALEQAYQQQVAASAVSEPEADPVVAESASAAEEAESVTPEVDVPGALAPIPDERVAQVEVEAGAAEAAPAEPLQVATVARTEQKHETVQQVAVLYQPVYVLPPADPGRQPQTSPPRRSVGRDPWAPATISSRHNPWGTSSMSGGAWSTIGVAGGVWTGSSTPRSSPRR